uniref:Uncharacterized protein n=1 Tax=Arundo donax TaxID=35708 RepID=A0A0A9FH44_ARUDO
MKHELGYNRSSHLILPGKYSQEMSQEIYIFPSEGTYRQQEACPHGHGSLQR